MTILRIKLLAYRLLTTKLGRSILNLMSFGVNVPNLKEKRFVKNAISKKKFPFLVAITIDTESGYVEKSERRVWQKENPDAFIGYHQGLKNIFRILDKHKVKSTIFLSTQCFSSKGKIYSKIVSQLKRLVKGGNEIGLHLHADSDKAIQKKLSRKLRATSAFFYDYDEKLRLLKASKDIVIKNLGEKIGKDVTSFRWGNWAMDSDGAKALNKLGFKIDSSATPGIMGHFKDTMRYDWSKVNRHYPWKLSIKDYQATNHNNSNVTEIPIATFSFFGIKMRADPVNSVLLNEAFEEYYKNSDRSKSVFPFVILTHSPEGTYSDGRSTRMLKDLENFIILAKKHKDVRFVTLKEAYRKISIS